VNPSLQFNDALAYGIADQIGLGAQTKLAHHTATVILNSAWTERESPGDLCAGKALSYQVQNLSLAVAQCLVGIECALLRLPHVGVNSPFSQWWAEVAPASNRVAYRLDQFRDAGILQYITGGPILQCLQNVIFFGVH